jgi:hypothetical protein
MITVGHDWHRVTIFLWPDQVGSQAAPGRIEIMCATMKTQIDYGQPDALERMLAFVEAALLTR